MIAIKDKCIGCGICVKNCPVGALHLVAREDNDKKKRAEVNDLCVECGVCSRVCPVDAIAKSNQLEEGEIKCGHCSVQCHIGIDKSGACGRYTNTGSELVRNRPLVLENTLVNKRDFALPENIQEPIITAVGSGTNYPCLRPAPYIVSETRDGVDVVTVVTEAPLSYSGVTLKIDTNTYLGEEGDPVYRDNTKVGMVETEQYGSKMIAIGGANSLTGKDGFIVARTICDLANGKEVTLKVNRQIELVVQRDKAPIINGVEEKYMRIGCGSATVGLFADIMNDAVDECIVIDHHVCGLFTEHLAGKEVGRSWSGVGLNARKSSNGRYFGELGDGIGGTDFQKPIDAIGDIDLSIAKAGQEILVTNTTGEVHALFSIQEDGSVKEIEMTEAAQNLVDTIRENCQTSRTTVLYVGGTGGSARGGVTKAPKQITEAVQNRRAQMTVAGAPVLLMPGGGLNFLVDTAKTVTDSFTWVPTPATVCPVEYTMTKDDYEAIHGHMDAITDMDTLRQDLNKNE